jgi:hypothetical protein
MAHRTTLWCDYCGKELHNSTGWLQWAACARNGHRYYEACREHMDALVERVEAEVATRTQEVE